MSPIKLEGNSMVKCMECGNEVRRVNVVHLKSKKRCTGIVQSFVDYVTKYPDAQIMDEDVRKRTTLTLETFILKYGNDVGRLRWDSYRNKQAYSNGFEYKTKKFGWSKEEFDEFNRSRAVTLTNFIKKCGEYEGLLKWQAYCDRQRYTTSREYFISEYGEGVGTQKWNAWDESRAIQSKINLNKASNSSISQAEVKFFNEITPLLELDEQHRNRWFYTLDGEKRNIDYLDYTRMVAIEFYGDYYHMNPSIYEATDWNPTCRVSAEERWRYDNKTLNSLKDGGFVVCVVWESDWRKNSSSIKEALVRCLNMF